MYTYVHTYMCMCVYIYIHIHIYIYTYVFFTICFVRAGSTRLGVDTASAGASAGSASDFSHEY